MKMPPDHFWEFMEDGDLSKFAAQETKAKPLTYAEIYRNLDGMTALAVAAATPLRRQKDEKDTAFVKRIVATFIKLHADQQDMHK
jgi:hypothetical protein